MITTSALIETPMQSFGVFPSCQPESIPAARKLHEPFCFYFASSILKACGETRTRTGIAAFQPIGHLQCEVQRVSA